MKFLLVERWFLSGPRRSLLIRAKVIQFVGGRVGRDLSRGHQLSLEYGRSRALPIRHLKPESRKLLLVRLPVLSTGSIFSSVAAICRYESWLRQKSGPF